jgi:hypothetical protein
MPAWRYMSMTVRKQLDREAERKRVAAQQVYIERQGEHLGPYPSLLTDDERGCLVGAGLDVASDSAEFWQQLADEYWDVSTDAGRQSDAFDNFAENARRGVGW